MTALNSVEICTETKAFVAENEHVYLRDINEKDAAFMLALTNERGWLEQIGDKHIHSIKQAKQFIRTGPMQTYQKYGFGLYLVVDKQSEKAVGVCGLLQRSYLSSPDLGYAISRQHQRQGFAFMSCQLVLNMINQLTPATCIYASTKDGNIASQRLLQKLGFKRDGGLICQLPEENLLLFRKDIAQGPDEKPVST